MSFFKSIKSAFGGSDGEDYDVYGQPTTFVNPFSKDKNLVEREHDQEDLQIELDQHEEYAIDAEFADKAARLMNDEQLMEQELAKKYQHLRDDYQQQQQALVSLDEARKHKENLF